jgi:uncharacterized protein (TIGR03437 family)
VYLVSENQIDALIPYEISGDSFATFQVTVNGSASNKVTVYADKTAPGIYTLAENGIGDGAILHANYSVVSDSSPAVPGETVLLFMNGLGTVTPPVDDGAAASSTSLSDSDEFTNMEIVVLLDDGADSPVQANVAFAGLAPGFAGLYQVNFTIPDSGLANGEVSIAFNTNEALNEMSTISLSGFSTRAEPNNPNRRASILRSRALRVRGTHGKMKTARRALPAR